MIVVNYYIYHSRIGILTPDCTFITKDETVDLTGIISFEGLNLNLKIKINVFFDVTGTETTGQLVMANMSIDHNKSSYNRATSSMRQVGSTMKPYLYYAALESGFTTSSSFIENGFIMYASAPYLSP